MIYLKVVEKGEFINMVTMKMCNRKTPEFPRNLAGEKKNVLMSKIFAIDKNSIKRFIEEAEAS